MQTVDTTTTTETPAGAVDQRLIKWLFIAASFLGSSLLFLVQPMVARLLLPIAGGSSALWNTAMVFFQVSLLAAYLFAHLASTRLQPRIHAAVQIAVFVAPLLLVLPVRVPDGWVLPAGANVSIWALGTLAVIVGLPFFAVSTASPTLQRWFAMTDHPDAADPYFLYAAGNVGAVLALISYPVLIEPLFTLEQQGRLWAGLYGVFVACSAVAAYLIRNRPQPATVEDDPENADQSEPVDRWRQRAKWVGLAAIPSALLLGVTNYITTDLASFPLLWVVPLLGYLLSFVLAFGSNPERLVARARLVVLIGIFPLMVTLFVGLFFLLLAIAIQLIWFFAAAAVCHGRLAIDRPQASRLTEFYLSISIGGAIGGTLTVLVAPVVFNSVLEYPIAIGLAFFVVLGFTAQPLTERIPQVLAVAVVVVAVILTSINASLFIPAFLAAVAATLLRFGTKHALVVAFAGLLLMPPILVQATNLVSARTPFGVYRVHDQDDFRALLVGTTVHGTQDLQALDDPTPSSYYHPNGPLGQVFAQAPDDATIGVVGLGSGAIAAWARPGDHYFFYEIDPEVVRIAEDPELFTYLARSPATIEIEVGDGRLGVVRSEEQFDILVLDAFSSDAVPVHLMTLEATEAYLEKLSPDGLLIFNISNRYFDLEPVLGRIAEELDLVASSQFFIPESEDEDQGATSSQWVVMSRSDRALEAITTAPEWEPAATDSPLWTDDYSFVLGALSPELVP